ncbi:AraC family transcriptional regulator [Micromonospora sp. CPCC 205371]|nr:AraC family transcriptional regulator [Micromonospora sp. CPCC 205371]
MVDHEPVVPAPFRVMDGYVLSAVTGGTGSYRHHDGLIQPIGPGTFTIVPPGVPHWYGTPPGQPWTETFAVFAGPLFDMLAGSDVLAAAGPRSPRPAPSIAELRTVLGARPRSARAAERQLLALADWLLDTAEPDDGPVPSDAVAAAAAMLAGDLSARLDMRSVAVQVGLPYDVFRHRFARELGESPLAFRNARRLRAAANLLRVTDMTVREIALAIGYTDEFHLSRRFRAHFGVPPRDYRTAR